jgi:hypothetical protein
MTLLDKYKPVSSRGGLVVLRRIKMKRRPEADRFSDMCVYDPLSGIRTFFSNPPDIQCRDPKYVVLTAADGIDTSFLLLVFDLHYFTGYVTICSVSLCGTRDHIWYGTFPLGSLKKRGDPAILRGGVLHWLPCRGKEILSFDLGRGETGSVELPPTIYEVNHDGNQLYLATSADRKLLKLLAIEGFIMYVWLQLPVSATGGSGWSLETVIDMEENLRSLDPHITTDPHKRIEFEGFGKRTGEVVFLVEHSLEGGWLGYRYVYSDAVIVFDLETKRMHRQKPGLSLLEIDLPSRLQTMKTFS